MKHPLIRSVTIFLILMALTFSTVEVTPVKANSLPALLGISYTFNVNSTLDLPDDLTQPGTCHTAANTCTLRAAIMQANRAGFLVNSVTINLPSGHYILTPPASAADGDESGDLNLTTPTISTTVYHIVGAGAATTIIDANSYDRVLRVHSGRSVDISGVTIQNGYLPMVYNSGCGIFNEGFLNLSDVVITNNHCAGYGGGIYNVNQLAVSGSTINLNTSSLGGGGIDESGSYLSIENSTISGNSSTGSSGGGILSSGAAIKISNSTISSNSAFGSGGGIYNASQNLIIINSTLRGNLADLDGGAILNKSTGQVNVYNSTIAFNAADWDADINGGQAGGIYNQSGGIFNLINSLVAGNSVSGAPIYDDCYGTLDSYGGNLIGAASESPSGASCTINFVGGSWVNLNDLNLLGPLQDNGGPTATIALLPGNNAIDNGNSVLGCVNESYALLGADQRGVARPQGGHCDIGAYELRPDGNDTTGVFRPGNGLLYLKNTNTTGFADVAINYGTAGDYPIAGDWDGNGTATIGIYRNGSFYLRNSNTLGFADIVFAFGTPGDQPVAGDWDGDGVDTIGVYSNGQFLLRNNNSAGTADMSFYLGNPGDVGIAGDWNGDGMDTTGVFRPSNGIIFLKNANTTGFADIALNYGLAGDMPVTGDWNNDGIDTIGVYRNAQFLLRNSNTIGFAEIVFGLGNPGDMPISGNWDGVP